MMIENVVFVPEMDEDIAVSYRWYETREPGFGKDFLRCVEAAGLLTIHLNPEIHPVVADDFL